MLEARRTQAKVSTATSGQSRLIDDASAGHGVFVVFQPHARTDQRVGGRTLSSELAERKVCLYCPGHLHISRLLSMFNYSMPTRKIDIQARPLALLVLVALFVAMVVGLPFGHQLFHESLIEPEHCPVHMLQTGLVLLGGALALVLVALTAPEPGPVVSRAVPLPLFSPRFTCPNRAPPRR